ILPQVIETDLSVAGVEAATAHEPEVAIAPCPCCLVSPRSRNVSGGGYAQHAVDARLTAVAANRIIAAHPRPLVREWIELPKLVQIAKCACGIKTGSSKKP